MTTRSRAAGASLLLAAAVLLIVATFCETPFLLRASAPEGALFWSYVVLFVLAAVDFAAAGLVISVGRGAPLAGSPLAAVGFAGYGLLWLVAQSLYLLGAYLAPNPAILTVSTVLSVVMLLFGLVAAIAIAARRILPGFARWSFLGSVVLSAVTGVIAGASDSAAVGTSLHLVSAAGLAVVAISYLGARERTVVRAG
jgi:hypothetical protein